MGRPKNEDKRSKDSIMNVSTEKMIKHHTKTKSGRIVKFQNLEVATKIFQLDHHQHKTVSMNNTNLQDLSPSISVSHQELPNEAPKKKRKISSQFRCKFCEKVYLGKTKMNNHYKLYPNHKPQPSENESNLFSHLLSLVRQKRTNKGMADTFFSELSSFVMLCEKLTPKLITSENSNMQAHQNTHSHVVDKNSASLLRINPGTYTLNMDIFRNSNMDIFDKDYTFNNPNLDLEQMEEILENHDLEPQVDDSQKILISATKPLIIIDDVPSLDGNECSSLLIRSTNELTNLTNISLETDF